MGKITTRSGMYDVDHVIVLINRYPNFSVTLEIKEELMEELDMFDENALMLWLELQS